MDKAQPLPLSPSPWVGIVIVNNNNSEQPPQREGLEWVPLKREPEMTFQRQAVILGGDSRKWSKGGRHGNPIQGTH